MSLIGVIRINREDAHALATAESAKFADLVSDIVGEWAELPAEPFELTLTVPAGGSFSQGTASERIEMDLLAVVRTLSGRLHGEGVMRHALLL